MQTIIGSGGAISIPLAKELRNYIDRVRLVSRNPKKVNDTDELFPVDVSDLNQLDKAIAGSEVVYITIGFDYKLKVWQNSWPPFIEAVIKACKKQGAKMVFFDNIYMYARTAIPHMTEDAPFDPPSKKGMVRKQLDEMILNEMKLGSLQAMIIRAADFYGPDTNKSVIGETVAKNFLKGKKAQAFGDIDRIHTYTFTPDAGRAVAILGNTPDAYGQVWHALTTREMLTTRQWIELIARELKVKTRIQKVPTWMIRLLGIFDPLLREFPEMMYQNEMDYVFDSSKFEKRFGITATPAEEGIRIMLDFLKKTDLPRGK